MWQIKWVENLTILNQIPIRGQMLGDLEKENTFSNCVTRTSILLHIVVGRMIPPLPPKVHRTHEYVTLHSKRDLADVGILREGDYPSGPNIITKALKRGDRSSESKYATEAEREI